MTQKEKAIRLHERAVDVARRFLKCEAELVEILRAMDATRAFESLGYTSLFAYALSELKFSESVALNFISVARKSAEVPELGRAIASGELGVNKARKVLAMLKSPEERAEAAKRALEQVSEMLNEKTPVAQQQGLFATPPSAAPSPPPSTNAEWIDKAKNLSSRALEKEVAKANPQQAKPDCVSYLSEKLVHLSVSVDEKVHKAIRRVQDLESQRLQRAATLEETLAAMSEAYLQKKDPIEKAKRAEAKRRLKTLDVPGHVRREAKSDTSSPSSSRSSSREPIPAATSHQVILRDQHQCTNIDDRGNRCTARRWLQTHHIVEVSAGGGNELDNLTTLCSAHHRQRHRAS